MDIAIVIPTFNRARLIPAALDCLVHQTTPLRLQAAVVDDGSTDDTAQVMKPYLERHADPQGKVHITYTRLEKKGVVTARNTAIAQTTAPLIAFLDSDDYWHPDKLEAQVQIMHRDSDVGLVHTDFHYVDAQGQITQPGPHRAKNPCQGRCVDALMDEDLVIFSSVLVRRSIVDRVASAESHGLPFDPRWTNAQDYDLLLRCARFCSFAYLPQPLTYYRLHDSHGAMGNLKRAYGFHARVQMDFVHRHGQSLGLSLQDGQKRAGDFIFGRAQSMFWQRNLETCLQLCDLAGELGLGGERFDDLHRRASRPRWLYRVKDTLDRWRKRS